MLKKLDTFQSDLKKLDPGFLPVEMQYYDSQGTNGLTLSCILLKNAQKSWGVLYHDIFKVFLDIFQHYA